MSHVGKLRKTLFGIIDAVCSQREKYFASSRKNFTRKGKFMPQDIFKSILLMENKSMFNGFVSETNDNNAKYPHKGYRIFAVDGSDSHVPDNPDDPDAYFPNPKWQTIQFVSY